MNLLFLALLFRVSLAAPPQFGSGGSSTARVNGLAAERDNPYAALYNPAVMAAQSQSLFGFSSSGTFTRHEPMGTVLVDSEKFRTVDAKERREEAELPASNLTLWSLGVTYPFSLPPYIGRRAGLGVSLGGPYGRFRSATSGTPYDFYSLRYGNSENQFRANLGTSIEILKETLFFGVGLAFFFTTSGSADTVIATENPTGRLNYEAGLNSAPVLGLYGRVAHGHWGLVFHDSMKSRFEQTVLAKTEIGGSPTLSFPNTFRTTSHFEPKSLDLEAQHEFGIWKVSTGVSHQWWTEYEPSYVVSRTTDSSGEVHTTLPPEVSMKNTINPRVSLEVPIFHRFTVSGGYQYRPSPVASIEGAGNIVDSNTHVFGLSAELRIEPSPLFPLPLRLGAHGQYHSLETREVLKSDPNFIGAPGYKIQGNAYTCGLSIEAKL